MLSFCLCSPYFGVVLVVRWRSCFGEDALREKFVNTGFIIAITSTLQRIFFFLSFFIVLSTILYDTAHDGWNLVYRLRGPVLSLQEAPL